MRLLDKLLNKGLSRNSESSTTSGVGKQEFMDWATMTQQQRGYFSALTMSRDLRGAGLTFRVKAQNLQKMFTLSMPGKTDESVFLANKRYKIRLQFDNAVIMYAHLHAYKHKHATIVDVSDDFLENVIDSQKLKIEFIGETGKKITTKFSLKGAASAIQSAIARCNEEKAQINTWFLSTSH
jgi:hypothetical protein